jgi:diketogulonate reductase-like aldo/keto reductase
LQQDIVVLPKSTNLERIRQNGDVFEFSILDADMAYLETFNENLVSGWDPTDVP